MRILGLVLALGAITWTLYQMAGGGEAETVIPTEHQQAIDKAKQLEQAMKDAAQRTNSTAQGES